MSPGQHTARADSKAMCLPGKVRASLSSAHRNAIKTEPLVLCCGSAVSLTSEVVLDGCRRVFGCRSVGSGGGSVMSKTASSEIVGSICWE